MHARHRDGDAEGGRERPFGLFCIAHISRPDVRTHGALIAYVIILEPM